MLTKIRETGSLVKCCWECKKLLPLPPQNTAVLLKLNTPNLPHDIVIVLLGIYPQGMKPMFIENLYTNVHRWSVWNSQGRTRGKLGKQSWKMRQEPYLMPHSLFLPSGYGARPRRGVREEKTSICLTLKFLFKTFSKLITVTKGPSLQVGSRNYNYEGIICTSGWQCKWSVWN